jgi:hypothetical protein
MRPMTLESLEHRQLLAGITDMHSIETKSIVTIGLFALSFLAESAESYNFMNDCNNPENTEKCAALCSKHTQFCVKNGFDPDGKPLNNEQPTTSRCPFKRVLNALAGLAGVA